VGEVSGFNVHATICVGARDRARLERLCPYLLRPPIALERREQHPSGKLRYSLKKPWSDGSVAVLLEPFDLLSRLCARFGARRSERQARPDFARCVDEEQDW
jgi:hypothetical protein